MNRVCLVGRLTKEPELRYAPTGTAITTFTLAVDRAFKSDNGPSADFPQIVSFKQTAEAAATYLKKGRLCSVDGRIQTRSYENGEGKKVYVTEVVADNVRFLEKADSGRTQADRDPFINDGMAINISDDDLPF